MSAGSFDGLSSLNLSEGGNEAEKLATTSPQYSAVAFRAWLETVLDFLDKKHFIGQLPVDHQGKGAIAKRIERLPESINISRAVLKAMDDVRLEGNEAAHPKRGINIKHRFTLSGAEATRNKAWLIRDWLQDQYVQPSKSREESTRSNASTARTAERSFWFDDVESVRPGVSKPIAMAAPETYRYEPPPGSTNSGKALISLFVVLMIFGFGIAYLKKHEVDLGWAKPLRQETTLIRQFDNGGSLVMFGAKPPGGATTPINEPQPPLRADKPYSGPCGAGQVFSRGTCTQIAWGAVDFTLNAGDSFTLPAGEEGYLTIVSGEIFAKDRPGKTGDYLPRGGKKFITSSFILWVQIPGTRATFRPGQ
jgi:hypothetical protein